MNNLIKREEYSSKLHDYKDKNLIKVLAGIRRSGKSTILKMFTDELRASGVSDSQIIFINFENMDYHHLLTADKLYEHIKPLLQTKKQNYIFLDEIQNVVEFEKVVDSLHILSDVDIYITGSNAYFLSGELATLLTGRYIQIDVYPLSFSEYFNALDNPTSLDIAYDNYVKYGSFPDAVNLFKDDPKKVNLYLKSIYDTVIFKDIIERKNIKNELVLQDIVKYIFNNISNITSPKKISDFLTANGRSVSNHTVESYLQAMIDSFLIYPVSRYDIKGKQILQTLGKYYVVDLGLRRLLSDSTPADYGRMLENIVYLELKRRYEKVWIGKNYQKEIDFVVHGENDMRMYFQVALTVRDEKTRKRELSSLNLSDNYPKFLLTLDPETGNYNGIKQVNAINWLLDKS